MSPFCAYPCTTCVHPSIHFSTHPPEPVVLVYLESTCCIKQASEHILKEQVAKLEICLSFVGAQDLDYTYGYMMYSYGVE